MPYCPSCRYEYTDEVTTCPDCGVELVDELPEEEETVEIYQAEDHNEATIIRSILEEAGIPVRERADVDQELDVFAGPFGEESIEVPVSVAEQAKKVINEALEAGKNMPEEETSAEESTEETVE